MNEQEQQQYEQVDMPFYKDQIAPILPDKILDFHTHIWTKDVWKAEQRQDTPGGKYMVTTKDYTIEDLIQDGKMMFPDRCFEAVCFGQPSPTADLKKSNDYVIGVTGNSGLYPLIITGRDTTNPAELEEAVTQKGFLGYKVFLNWVGDDYGKITIEDMIGPAEMEIANKLGLIVLLHVPRAERLADPDVCKGVERLSKDYPNASIVLAHCGRCYLPDEAKQAMGAMKSLENVYLDTAMVMEPTAIEIVLDNVGPAKLLFATDLPVANMRGRRVYVMDHWVDLVLEGYSASAYRVSSNNMRATFMVYEIILAIRRAAERIGLSEQQIHDIFYQNGMSLLEKVMNGPKHMIIPSSE